MTPVHRPPGRTPPGSLPDDRRLHDHAALDPVASLMLDEAGDLSGRVLVLDDVDGALTREVERRGAEVRAWCDDVRDQANLPRRLVLPQMPDTTWIPDLVLWRLPRAVAAVADLGEGLASWLPAHARVVAGGRIKHMTLAQNAALERSFATVQASLGRQKSRVIHASGPRPSSPRWPRRRFLPEAGITLISRGNVFSANKIDGGTHLLIRTLERVSPTPADSGSRPAQGVAIDFGCGTGIIASWLALRGYAVTGIDVSQAAIQSTLLTAAANQVQVGTRRADGLGRTPSGSATIIVSNPPFHRGAAKDSRATLAMIARAGQVLRPGGELWLVYNSHLPYLPLLREQVGITTIEARDRSYLVTRSLTNPDYDG
ncbi:MAG: class I SAM-dependent methyltransferase [Propioniciclava sp.]